MKEKIDVSTLVENQRDLEGLLNDECLIYGFKLIEQIQENFDGEKGYVEYDIIIQRKTDGKFFKGTGEDWGRGEQEVIPYFYEVQRKEKTIYYYE